VQTTLASRRSGACATAGRPEPTTSTQSCTAIGSSTGERRTYRAELADLPDGTYAVLDGAPWLVWRARLHAWSDAGYRHARARPKRAVVDVLTPRSIVPLFAAGYVPGVHATADARS